MTVTIEQALELASQHRAAGRLADAEGVCRQVLSADPSSAGAFRLLANVASDADRHDTAVELLRRASNLYPSDLGLCNQLANALQSSRQFDDAVACYRRGLAMGGDCPEILFNLGDALCMLDRFDEAIACFRRASAKSPDDAQIHNHLGIALQRKGQVNEAIAAFERAVELKSDDADALNNLGVAYTTLNRTEEALGCFRRALHHRPVYPEAHNNMATALKEVRRTDEAIEHYRQAIAQSPTYLEASNNLGGALLESGRIDDAIAEHERALALSPDSAETHNLLGSVYNSAGRLDDAITHYRLAIARKPMHRSAHSNLLNAMQLHPRFSPAEILSEHCQWERQQIGEIARGPWHHDNDRSPDRKLRIGHVSPDFRHHVTTRFLLDPFAAIDRQNFEIVCFSGVRSEDSSTQKLRELSPQWHSTVGLSDAQVAQLIRDCKIDILIDLSLHLAGNRLGVFALKPAPVQVTALAYPGTSGLSAMDYRFTDAHLDPPGENDAYYSEACARLKSYWCYRPWEDAPEVSALGALDANVVTLASLNNFAKVSDAALELWGQILAGAPKTRLLIHAPPGNHRKRVDRAMAKSGVSMSRVEFAEFRSLPEYLRMYERIDITLDPFPCAGGTTTCDSLWMGVPVVTLAGQVALGRPGVSILNQIDLGDLVATSPEEYVEIAASLACDLPRLAELRSTLRPRMKASPLCDPISFIRDVETQYRAMWRKWCASPA